MPRHSRGLIEFDALSLEGGIFPPEWLGRIAALEAPAQAPADYGVPKGLQLRDEVGRYWRISQALWADFAAAKGATSVYSAAITRAFLEQLLRQVFGFTDLAKGQDRDEGGRTFRPDLEALGGRVPVIVRAPAEGLDESVARHADGGRRRSAWGVLQEYLNAADRALWGLTSNGLSLRLGRDNASLTRPAWFEADLERIFSEERFADFSVLWLLVHASRFGVHGQPVEDCALEEWRAAAQEEGSRAREKLSGGVRAALLELGQGFLDANAELRRVLSSGELTRDDYYNELLRLVYRAIFLLTVEERGILHPAEAPAAAVELYREGYGLRRLRERALRRRAHDRGKDLWESLKPVFRALGRAGGEPLLGLPGMGGLFAPEQCPHLDAAALENRRLLTAMVRLAWIREGAALARVNWKDMGPEELGSVYESLLELVPLIAGDGRTFTFAGSDESAGNARKLSGSYYTPDALVQELLDSALEPVVSQRVAAHPEEPQKAILSITVLDPACGSGHFLLGAARRLAGHLARLRVGGTPGAGEYRLALRDVVTHSIHGVDRNPMAIELARMALWLEAYTPERALGFLDHHLVCGDALLGLLDLTVLRSGIPDDAYQALTGDDAAAATTLRKLNREGRKALEKRQQRGELSLQLGTRSLADAYAQLEALGDARVEEIQAKADRLAQLRSEIDSSPVALAADLFLAAFLMPKRVEPGAPELTAATAAERFPATGSLAMALEGALPPSHSLSRAARRACRDARVLHWPLAFPQVFERGGFDVVLGNPPWEVSQLSEEEYFSSRAPQIARLAGARRKTAIRALQQEHPALWDAFVADKFRFESANNSFRTNPRFSLTAFGKLNTYALFAETAYRLLSTRGRSGLVLPTGIGTDDTTKAFFDDATSEGRLVSLLAFENEEFIFRAVHHAFKFCLLTLTGARHSHGATFVFFARRPQQIHDARRRFSLSDSDFRLFNPNTRTCPVFRSERDAELTRKIYRNVPVLIDEAKDSHEGNPWHLSFSQGLFNMTSDSGRFLDAPGQGILPLYEAKMMHQFDHRWATYEPCADGRGAPSSRDATDEEKADAAFEVRPRYWVNRDEINRRLQETGWIHEWFMGWRRICRVTDERTLIASTIPMAGVGDSIFLWLPTRASSGQLAAFIGMAGTLVLDYVTRQKQGGTNLSYYYMRQLPMLAPGQFRDTELAFIVPRVLELTYNAQDLRPWAEDLGYPGPPFRWDPERRALLRADLDAFYAQLYGLTRDELRYILDPADVMGPDYPSETFRVLKASEERQFGEYRTRRLVLEAWDRLFGN